MMRKLIGTVSLAALGLFATHTAKADACNGVSAAKNLISNCSFETGDFTGWTGTTTTDPFSEVDRNNPYTGIYAAALGSYGATSTLSQTFSTNAGYTYSVIFALMNEASPASGDLNSFQALFGNTTLLSESAVLAGGYILYSYSAIASGPSTTLSFVSRNDSDFFDLDSISVANTAAPEPSSLLLLGTGALGLLGVARRRLKHSSGQMS